MSDTEQKEKLFQVDYDKKLYRIIIDVCENGSVFSIEKEAEDYMINYHNVIGVIETIKSRVMEIQGERNREEFSKKQDQPKP